MLLVTSIPGPRMQVWTKQCLVLLEVFSHLGSNRPALIWYATNRSPTNVALETLGMAYNREAEVCD